MINTFLTVPLEYLSVVDVSVLQRYFLQQTANCNPSAGALLIYSGAYGFFVNVNGKDEIDNEALADALNSDGFSVKMTYCCFHARNMGVNWIRFDRDADHIEGLQEQCK